MNTLGSWGRAIARAGAVLIALAGGVSAYPEESDRAVIDALDLPALLDLMRDEAVDEARMIAQDFGAGQRPPSAWMAATRRIHDPDRLLEPLREGLLADLAPHDTRDLAAFLTGADGREMLALEISARRALMDPDVEALAEATLDRRSAGGEDALLEQVERLIAAGDLIERNVQSGMNALLAFDTGMLDAGVGLAHRDEGEVLRDVWAQQDDIRGSTARWLRSFLVMAYAPIEEAVLEDWIVLSHSASGRAYTSALFRGFDALYERASYQMGQSVILLLEGQGA